MAKPNELAGVSGKVEGKIYIPFVDGDKIQENDITKANNCQPKI